ncbi:MAG: prohibitin family protein [Deltaproteobacteria bacterium]|nr:prohibitin family protein [Deltaproteobacteria bacterium]
MDMQTQGKVAEVKGMMKKKLPRIIGLVVAAIVFIFFLNPFVIIGAGERGVVLNFGAVSPEVLGEGLHFRIPIMQKIIKMDVKVQKSQTDAEAASKDLQETFSTIALNFHILPEKVNWIYQKLGADFKERIIDPAVQEVVKAVTAKYTAVEVITQREKVRSEIRELLKQRLHVYNIIVDDFSIVNFKFSNQFTQAIENKQTAEQLALKAQRDLERIKIEAEQKVTQAQAEAEALRLQKENVTTPLVKLRQIEATLKAIEKWDGHLPKVTSGAIPFIDVKNLDRE